VSGNHGEKKREPVDNPSRDDFRSRAAARYTNHRLTLSSDSV